MSTAVRTSASTRETPPRTPALLRAIRIVHPFPTVLNVAATAGLAFVAENGGPNAGVLVRMLFVMFFAQCAIGITNDLYDRELDARTKPWKPLVAGLVSVRAATGLTLACVVASVAIGASLGWASAGLVAVGTGCGLAYDMRLKRTLWSAVPYMMAIPILPLWVYVTLGREEAVLWWLLPLAGLIGLALHLANTLPDIESDAAHGVRGLAHRLGVRGSTFVSWGAFAGALVLAVVIGPFVDADVRWYASALGVGIGCLVVAVCGYAVRGETAQRVNFAAMSIGAAVTAVGWLAAVT